MQERQPAVPKFLTGVIPPMYTPRFEDGRLDLAGARSMVRWFKSRKCVSSIFARSGMGEMYAFTMDEARELIATTVDEAAGGIGVVAGCAGEFDGNPEHRPDPARYIAQSVELSQYAEKQGADAVVHVLPMALAAAPGKSLEDTLFDFYRAINDAVGIPIAIYQAPGLLPEYRMTPSLLSRLLTLPRIKGMKVSSSEHAVMDPIAAGLAGHDFALIAGAETFYLEGLQMGAVGVIGGGAATHPEILHAVKEHFLAGRLDRARAAQDEAKATQQELDTLHVSWAIAGKIYIAAQGFPMEPYNARREAVQAYGARPTTLPPADVMAKFTEIVDRHVGPYRKAVQAGGALP